MTKEEEKIKMVALAQGCRQAFESLYYFYRPQLYQWIYKLVRSHETSQELFQDVFVKIWNYREQLTGIESFKNYLYTITQNLVYDYYRKVAADRNKIESFKRNYVTLYCNDVEQQINFKETVAHFEDVLSLVPQKSRQVYVLCKLEGKSYKEVSKLLNISMSTVNNHIVKATNIIKNNWNSDVFGLMLFFLLFQ